MLFFCFNHVPRHTHIIDNIVHFHLICFTGLSLLFTVHSWGGVGRCRSPFPRVTATGKQADQYSAKVRNEWSYTFTFTFTAT